MHERVTHITTAAPETCSYIWTTSFAEWLTHSHADTTFWISGKPGSGKSTLMKYVVSSQHTQYLLSIGSGTTIPWTIVHFFFDFRATKTVANTQEGLFQSLLYQILGALPISRSVFQKYEIDVEHVLVSHLMGKTVDTIVKILQNENMRILLLVDGLDETEGNIRLLINSVKSVQKRTGIRVCLASRPEPLIANLLQECPSIRLQDYNAEGIAAHLRSSFEDIERAMLIHATPSEQIVAKILAKAEGVFLYANYCADSIIDALVRGHTEHEAWQDVHSHYGELGTVYDRMLERIPTICRPEVAMILRLLESAVHPITIAMLFRVWLYVMHRTRSPGQLPVSMGPPQFRTRLQGVLGGLVELREARGLAKNVSIDHHNPIHNQVEGFGSSYDNAMADNTFSPKVEEIGFSYSNNTADDTSSPPPLPVLRRSRATRSTAGNYDSKSNVEVIDTESDEIRLVHETLRSYLRTNKLVDSWLNAATLATFPTHMWLDIYCEVLISSGNACDHWDFLRKTASACSEWSVMSSGMALDELVQTWVFKAFGSFEECLSAVSCGHLLLEAVATLTLASMHVSDMDEPMFEKMSRALRLPILLLNEFMADEIRDYNVTTTFISDRIRAIRTQAENELWSLDLAYAASKQWDAYFYHHRSRLAAVSDTEKGFILQCLWKQCVLFPSRTSWIFSLSDDKERIVELLLEHGPIRSPHVAIYLESVAHIEPPWFLQHCPEASESVLAHPYVSTGPWEWWPFLRREGMHLLEIWARLPYMSEAQYAARLEYLGDIGIGIHDFRHKNGDNLVMLVVDTCKGQFDFVSLLGKLRVLVSAHAVLFHQHDERDRTAMWRVRDMVVYIKRCVVDQYPDFDWDRTALPSYEYGGLSFHEVKQFELLLDKLEVTGK